ncbi:MAG: carotenoid 1,2-hydratase [Burkholderiaceae bacterium]|nr:carotenoid 1,2-hydratase [Burkholderiaceae bacterium]
MQRRDLLLALGALTLGQVSNAAALGVTPRPLRFPADFGAHPDTHIEWWYLTGALAPRGADAATPIYGFQLTFFRVRTAVDPAHPSRFAAKQLLMAHAALTDLSAKTLRHDQALARSGFGLAGAGEADTDVVLHGWHLRRHPSAGYRAELKSERANFALALDLKPTQPLLLQGQAGYSRKGPEPGAASHYYSEPQLQLAGELTVDGKRQPVQGRAWLDHEWSNQLLGTGPDSAIGWDWTGINLTDGGALTLFRLRRADGSVHWAGGSYRAAGQAQARDFAPTEVSLQPGRIWKSARTGASYPVSWRLNTPIGAFELRALLDDQELDARSSTGTVYWEGLSELLDGSGRRVGLGYLEMTGYAGALRLG